MDPYLDTAMDPTSTPHSCLSGFSWNGTPTGRETTLANNNTYVSGTNKEVAILMIHDIFGWTFTNLRLLADHYARDANATVYLPDLYVPCIVLKLELYDLRQNSADKVIDDSFDGEVVTPDMLDDPEKAKNFDHLEFVLGRNGKEKRFPDMVACARALKEELGFKKVGAVGYCYGGWAVFQLGGQGSLFPKPTVQPFLSTVD